MPISERLFHFQEQIKVTRTNVWTVGRMFQSFLLPQCQKVSHRSYNIAAYTVLQHMCGAPPIQCTCIILSDADAYKKISALLWIHSSSLWDLKAEHDTTDMTSNNQHHFDSAASLVNFIGPGKPGWNNYFQPLFRLSFNQHLTVWHANTLSLASWMPYQQSFAVPPCANCEGWLTCSLLP